MKIVRYETSWTNKFYHLLANSSYFGLDSPLYLAPIAVFETFKLDALKEFASKKIYKNMRQSILFILPTL